MSNSKEIKDKSMLLISKNEQRILKKLVDNKIIESVKNIKNRQTKNTNWHNKK